MNAIIKLILHNNVTVRSEVFEIHYLGSIGSDLKKFGFVAALISNVTLVLIGQPQVTAESKTKKFVQT